MTSSPVWQPSRVRPFDRFDIYIATAFFLLSWAVAMWYVPKFRSIGGHPQFYQVEFAPAVLSACGRGYVAPALESTPPSLAAFLTERAETFRCTDLPREIVVRPPSVLQWAGFYLLRSAALVWRITGVSWRALDLLTAALFAIAITAGYLALRFVAGPVLSAIGALLWLGSPIHFGILPDLRDYSKAPFFALLLIALPFVVRERRLSRLLIAGALFGLVQGIGFGMRTDIIMNLAPFFLVLFVAAGDTLLDGLRAKIACAVVTILVFTVAAWPILRNAEKAEAIFHVAALGLTTSFDEPLGIRPAPYDFGYLYDDSFVSSEILSDWSRSQLGSTSADPDRIDYPRAAKHFYLKLAATFPGDFLSRMAASTVQTLNLPSSFMFGRVPPGVTGVFATLEESRSRLMPLLIGAGPLIALTMLVIVSVTSLRRGVVAFVLVAYWTAFPFIQFHVRHAFHLELLVLAGMTGVLSMLFRSALSLKTSRPAFTDIALAAGSIAGLCAFCVLAIAIARAVQHPRVSGLLTAYERAATAPIASDPLFPPDRPARFQAAMLSIESRCAAPAAVTVRYQPRNEDYTRKLELAPGGRVFMPVYASNDPGLAQFSGVEGPPCARPARLLGVDDLLWMEATLTPDWRTQPLHQRVDLGPAFPKPVWLRIVSWWPAFATLG